MVAARAFGAEQRIMAEPRVVLVADDAKLVQAVQAAAKRSGYRGHAFPLLKRQKPEWTRERWDKAVAELGRQ